MLNSRSQLIAYGYGSLIGTDLLHQACNGVIAAPVSLANCAVGKMDVHAHPIEPPSWRLTFGGPIEFDPSVTGPDLMEPFNLVRFSKRRFYCQHRGRRAANDRVGQPRRRRSNAPSAWEGMIEGHSKKDVELDAENANSFCKSITL